MKYLKTIIITILLITLSTQITYAASVGVTYQAHVQNYGWQSWKRDGEVAGTNNESLRLEALNANLENPISGMQLQYRTYIENIGWQDWKKNGEMSGTTDQGLRVEAIQIILNNSNGYHVRYRAHVENIGWQDWVYDGDIAGTTGQSLRMEAIQIQIVNDSNESIIDYVPAKDIADRIDSRTRDEFKNVVNNDNQLSQFYNSNEIEQFNQINVESSVVGDLQLSSIRDAEVDLSEIEKLNQIILESHSASEAELDLMEFKANRLELNAQTLNAGISLSTINSQLIAIGIPASLRYGILAEAAAVTAALADGPLPFGDIALIAVSIGVGFIILANLDVIESKGTQIYDILYKEYKKISTSVGLKVQYAVSKSFDLIENAHEEKTDKSKEADGRKLPLTGEPNSVKELYNKKGKLTQRRHYDKDGKARVDEDFNDRGTPNLHSNPHYHEWDWSTGKPIRGDVINIFDQY